MPSENPFFSNTTPLLGRGVHLQTSNFRCTDDYDERKVCVLLGAGSEDVGSDRDEKNEKVPHKVVETLEEE